LKAKARASSSGTSTPAYKKKGRPFKIRHQPFIPQPEPIFNPFLCEWKDCQAELQNLETLRLHIHVVHKKREDGKVPCLWAKCGAKKIIEGEDGEKKGLDDHPRFASRQEWKDHLEVKHLVPFSWYMGDGPKATDLCKFSIFTRATLSIPKLTHPNSRQAQRHHQPPLAQRLNRQTSNPLCQRPNP
jgi:hypothetical protein